jgi:hypothetical protein
MTWSLVRNLCTACYTEGIINHDYGPVIGHYDHTIRSDDSSNKNTKSAILHLILQLDAEFRNSLYTS